MRTMLICAALAISSCTTTPIAVKLPLPPAPVYPTLTKAEISATACLARPIRAKLVKREALKDEYIKELMGIIRATNQ